MNTYTWQFPRLDVFPTYQTVANAVFQVHWRLTADNGAGRTAEAYGTTACGPINPQAFILFNELTPAEVTSWVEGQMSDELAQIKAGLDAKIQEAIAPTRLSLPPPW